MPAQSFAPTFLLTRPVAQSERFALLLRQTFPQIAVVVSPVLKTTYFAPALPLGHFAAVIFTSQAGVDAAQKLDTPSLPKLAYCVGPATQTAAQLAGFDARGTSGDLFDLIRLIKSDAPKGRLLYLRGTDITFDLDGLLENTQSLVVYQQLEQPLTPEARTLLSGPAPVILPVFSKRSANILAHKLTAVPQHCPIWGAALSPGIAQEMVAIGCEQMVTAGKPSNDALIFAITQLIGQSLA